MLQEQDHTRGFITTVRYHTMYFVYSHQNDTDIVKKSQKYS